MLDKLLQSAFKITPEMASGRIRNHRCEPEIAGKLEHILCCFVQGYNLALASKTNAALVHALDAAFDPHHVGFAYEGAGMGLAVLDLLAPGKASRLKEFVNQDGAKHDYIAMVGAGLAMARMNWAGPLFRRYFTGFDPLVRWCAADGYGFHEGYFSPARFVDRHESAPKDFASDEQQLFDSGVGRSLWWTCGASASLIAESISRFPTRRQGEMWCGIGVACAYAGGDEGESLLPLLELSGSYRADFLSGLPFAARMRQKAGNPSQVTDYACKQLLGRTVDETANLAGELLRHASESLGEHVGRDGYAFVRRGLTEELAREYLSQETITE
jgi:hypothetical protein